MKIIISGGGTGGHIYPAIAIADALKRRDKVIDILFVGAEGRMEMEKVPQAGYPIEGVWISGIQRKLTFSNLLFPFKLMSSMWKCRNIIRKFQPDAVIGVGGYASGPLVRVATKFGIPAILQEQNSYPGITNKWLASKASVICVAYPGMERFFPKGKIVHTGNPMRGQLQGAVTRAEALTFYNLDPAKKTIFIVGGSLGARTINVTMKNAFDLLKDRSDIQVLWQIGKLYAETYLDCPTAKLDNVHPMVFVDRMDMAYAAADLVISRAGAMTISEICLLGKASILIPSPHVAEDHQTHNAQQLVNLGAAKMVKDSTAPGEAIQLAVSMLEDPKGLREMEQAALELGKPHAADTIASIVIELAKSGKR